MIQPKVSVIIPIYNAGEYLVSCLDSVVGQTLKEIEIILVTDCPTDGSDAVAQRYADADPRVRLHRNKENLHIGLSRNVGLELATGEYITFCDHDDYMELDMLEKMYALAVERGFVVLGSHVIRSDKVPVYSGECHSGITPLMEAFYLTLHRKYDSLHCGGYVYCQLFKRQFIEKHKLRFVDTNRLTSEDLLFTIELYSLMLNGYANVSQYAYYDAAFYHHIVRPGSTGATRNYRDFEKQVLSIMYLDSIIDDTRQISVYQAKKRLLRLLTVYVYWLVKRELKQHHFKDLCKQLRLLRSNARIQDLINTYHYKYDPKLTPPKNVVLLCMKVFIG